MRLRSLAITFALASVGGLGACSMSARGTDTNAATPAVATIIEVENNGFLDRTIYVIPQNGSRQRVGVATGNSTTRLTIPASTFFGTTQLRFIADPIGGQAPSVSESVLVNAGDTVHMMIPNS